MVETLVSSVWGAGVCQVVVHNGFIITYICIYIYIYMRVFISLKLGKHEVCFDKRKPLSAGRRGLLRPAPSRWASKNWCLFILKCQVWLPQNLPKKVVTKRRESAHSEAAWLSADKEERADVQSMTLCSPSAQRTDLCDWQKTCIRVSPKKGHIPGSPLRAW